MIVKGELFNRGGDRGGSSGLEIEGFVSSEVIVAIWALLSSQFRGIK